MLNVGDKAPDFCLKSSDGNDVCTKDLRGKWVILYFYPKDNTKGCTKEALDFTQSISDFSSLGAVILGVSPDGQDSHQKFREKHDLKITLLSDPDHQILNAYGAWGTKNMYGKVRQSVIRSTFLIDPNRKIVQIWRNVRVKNHVDKVKDKLQLQVAEG